MLPPGEVLVAQVLQMDVRMGVEALRGRHLTESSTLPCHRKLWPSLCPAVQLAEQMPHVPYQDRDSMLLLELPHLLGTAMMALYWLPTQ